MSQKKVAILMLCHKLPNQINDFIERFDNKNFDVFLHIDKKSNIKSQIKAKENVYFISDEKRVDVRWGRYSQVEATLLLIEHAMRSDSYDYYWLCSGQDFPIKSSEEIYEFLCQSDHNYMSFCSSRNNPINGRRDTRFDKRCEVFYPAWLIGKLFVQRGLKKVYMMVTGGTGHTFSILKRNSPLGLKLFYGSQWWCLNEETIIWIHDFIKEHDQICNFFRTTICPEECLFQTLIMNMPHKYGIEPGLVYIDWSEGKSSPRVLTDSDYSNIVASEKLLARKIDSEKEPRLYQLL